MNTQPLLRFVHISDTHLNPDQRYTQDVAPHSAWRGAEVLVETLNALPFTPDFVLHTGDVAYDPHPAAYEAAHRLLSQIRYPVLYIGGNHDDPAAVQRIMMTRGDQPLYYEQEINGVQLVLLDSNAPLPPGYQPPSGHVDDAQLAWLNALCRADDPRPLVVAVHHNVLPSGIPWLDTYMALINGEAVHQALLQARHRLRGVFHGHVHMNLETLRDGILYSSVLSSWYQIHAWPGQTETVVDTGAEAGFNVVTVTAQQTLIRRHRYAVPG